MKGRINEKLTAKENAQLQSSTIWLMLPSMQSNFKKNKIDSKSISNDYKILRTGFFCCCVTLIELTDAWWWRQFYLMMQVSLLCHCHSHICRPIHWWNVDNFHQFSSFFITRTRTTTFELNNKKNREITFVLTLVAMALQKRDSLTYHHMPFQNEVFFIGWWLTGGTTLHV